MRKVPTTSHWTHMHSEHWNKYWRRGHYYRKRFPQYDLPKEEGCRRYVKEYYEECEEYEKSMPENFRIFDIEDLNSYEGVRSILEFCGISEEEMEIDEVFGTHINMTTDDHVRTVEACKEKYGEDY